MSDAFHQREDGFEKRFANDEALRFRAVARRNKAVALWAAEMKGLSGEAAARIRATILSAPRSASATTPSQRRSERISRTPRSTSPITGWARRLAEAMAEAIASIKAGK